MINISSDIQRSFEMGKKEKKKLRNVFVSELFSMLFSFFTLLVRIPDILFFSSALYIIFFSTFSP